MKYLVLYGSKHWGYTAYFGKTPKDARQAMKKDQRAGDPTHKLDEDVSVYRVDDNFSIQAGRAYFQVDPVHISGPNVLKDDGCIE